MPAAKEQIPNSAKKIESHKKHMNKIYIGSATKNWQMPLNISNFNTLSLNNGFFHDHLINQPVQICQL